MRTEEIAYDADGLRMKSRLYLPDGAGRRPGVLVFPEANGLSEHTKARAERLAELGFVALACDLHGEAKELTDFPEIMSLITPLREDPLRTRARAKGAFDALKARPEVDPSRIAAIGFCFGGTMALELARSGADLAGVVGFHSGLRTTRPEDARRIRGKILVCLGADDPAIPLEQRTAFEEEMRAGEVDWQMNVYGGVRHAFTNPDAESWGRTEVMRYDPQADRRSWAEMQAFFAEIFA